METLSPNKFRSYAAVVVRIIWMIVLVIIASNLLRPVMMIFNNESLGRSADRYVPFIIGGACLLVLLMLRNIFVLFRLIFAPVLVFRDTLRDKYIRVVRHTDDDGHTHETYYYYLYFDQFFGRFKKDTEVSKKFFDGAEIGKDYYLGIVGRRQSGKVFVVDKYQLTAAAQHALIPDARELQRRTHWRWYAPEEQPVVNDGGVKRITPEQIAEDIYTYATTVQKKKPSLSRILSGVLAVMFIVVFFGFIPAVFYRVGGLGGVLFGLGIFAFSFLPVGIIAFFVTRFSGRFYRDKKKEILAGHYKVILDKVAATEEHDSVGFSYRMIHEQMPVRLASGHTVNLSRSRFNNVRPGDNLYIVYLETGSPYDDKSIVAVYQEKLGKLDFGFEVTWAS